MNDWVILLIIVVIAYFLLQDRPVQNEEHIVWTDYRGHRQDITIDRRVH